MRTTYLALGDNAIHFAFSTFQRFFSPIKMYILFLNFAFSLIGLQMYLFVMKNPYGIWVELFALGVHLIISLDLIADAGERKHLVEYKLNE